MKHLSILLGITTIILVSCSNPGQTVAVTTMEVTRIVHVTTTPVPTQTLTPISTPNGATRVANAIGTPIVAHDCYKATDRQGEMNNCSNQRRSAVEAQMDALVNKIEEKYKQTPDDLNTFIQFQSEWADFVTRECDFRSGHIIIETNGVLYYKGGSMALVSYNECLVQKYEDRLRELQIQLYEFNI